MRTNDAQDVDTFTVDVPADKTKLHLEIVNNSTADEPQTPMATLFDADKSNQGAVIAPNARANVTHDFNVSSGEKVYLQLKDAGGRISGTPNKVTVSFR